MSPTSGVVLRGVVPVLETAFLDDGALDVDGFDRVLQHVLSTGVDGVMFAGFASEFLKLDPQERRELELVLLARTTQVEGVLSVVSVPEHATRLAVRHAQEAVAAGADALNVLPPFLMQPSPDAVVDHVAQVLAAVPDTPVVVQVAPALTGGALGVADLVRLAQEHANLAAVKVEAVPPGRTVGRLLAEGLPSLVGYAGLHLPDALARGAVGVQPGCSVVELYVSLWRLWSAGDVERFAELHGRMLPFLLAWMADAELVVAVEKRISFERGLLASPTCRAPGYRLDAHELASVDRFLAEFGPLLQSPGEPRA